MVCACHRLICESEHGQYKHSSLVRVAAQSSDILVGTSSLYTNGPVHQRTSESNNHRDAHVYRCTWSFLATSRTANPRDRTIIRATGLVMSVGNTGTRHNWPGCRVCNPAWIITVELCDDVINWKHFPRYWPFVRGIHRSPVNSPHKGQWRGAWIFSLICALNQRLSKQLWGWRFETPSCSLWRHCNDPTWSLWH